MKVASGPHAVPAGAWLSAIDDQISVAIANLYIRGLAIGPGYPVSFCVVSFPTNKTRGRALWLVIHQRKH